MTPLEQASVEEKKEDNDKTMEENKTTMLTTKATAPPQNFHPDFMFCGECTDCNKESTTTMPQTLSDYDMSTTQSSSTVGVDIRTKLVLSHMWKSPHHALVLQSILQPIQGVSKVIVDLEESAIYVDHDAACEVHQLVRVLQQGGYPATVAATHEQTDLDQDELMGRSNEPYMCRSVFFVQGICCASEVPSIRKIVKPIHGVSTLQINITTKRVYVQHDASIVSAHEIADRLSKSGFPASIIKNGGAVQEQQRTTTSSVGRTTLHAVKTLHNQDVSRIQAKLVKLPGIERIGVNVAESVIMVEHDIHILPAADLVPALQPDYETVLVHDAEADICAHTTALLDQPRSKYVESTLMISNLTTSHLKLIHKAIGQNYIRAQIRAVHPHIASYTLKVEHNPDLVAIPDICSTLEKYGFDVSVVTDGAVERLMLPLIEDENVNEQEQALAAEWESNKLHLNVILSGIFWIVSMLSAIGGVWEYLEYAGLLSVLFGLPPVALKAWRTLRRKEFDANCMMVTAALGAVALREFDEAASVSFLFAVSEFLEARATDKARKALSAIVQLRPDHANVIHPVSKEIVVVPAEKVPVGSLISVRTGDKIAADGIVVEGTSSVDESSLTGESVPVRKTVDDSVSGGGINIGTTQLVVRTTSSVEDSAVSRLIRLVEEAQANRSATEKMIDGFARAYTPAVVFMAGLMCTIPWFFGTETGRYWTLNGLIIIVIACPCALTISTPVTYAAGLAATAQRGIIVKGGASLEALGTVEKVVLDKTGTITEGKFNVSHLEEIGETRTRKEMLALLALMEAPSSHPVSATLVKAAKREGVSVPANTEVKEHTILKGEGVTAVIDGTRVYVGNRRLFEGIGMFSQLPQAYRGLTEEWGQSGGTVGFVGVDGEGIVGVFCMIDRIRDEARDVIAALETGGMEVMMLTGDGKGAANSVGRQVGLYDRAIHSELLPEDKLHFIGSLKHPKSSNSFGVFRNVPKVLFCGDGVNDAPALAVADVGVSMGEGAALAMETSDVTLMDSNLTKLLYVLKMGSRVVRTIRENIILSLFCKLVVVGLAFAGYMTLLYAIASDVGVMLLVTLNGMKLLPGTTELSQQKKTRWNAKVYDEVPLVGTRSPTGVAEVAEIV